MKSICILIFSLLFLYSFGSNKNTAKEPTVSTTPAKLELFVNQNTDPYTIPVNYILNIPSPCVPPKGYLLYIPYFVNDPYEYFLQPIIIYGKDFRDKNKPLKIPGEFYIDLSQIRSFEIQEENLQIKIRDTVPFQLWMPQAKLKAAIVCEDRQKEYSSTLILADGMVYLPEGPGPVRVKYVKKETDINKQADFHILYPANVSFVHTETGDNLQQLEQMKKLLKQISQNPGAKLKQIILTGCCSPDGSFSYNKRLALKRADNLFSYLQKSAPNIMEYVKIETIPQDWQGLQTLIEQADIKNKNTILNILNKPSSGKLKQTALRELPNYNYLINRIYPQLQQTHCIIYYTIKETQTVPEPE